MRKFISIAALTLVAACGSFDQDAASSNVASNECNGAVWNSFGFEDGVRGLENAEFVKRNEICGQEDINLRRDRYMAGYAEGVARFCTAENGYNQGVTGYVYTGICPIGMEDGFVKALKAGHRASTIQNVAGRT